MQKVLVPLAEGCEELEAVTVIDILRRGGVEVLSASLGPSPIEASRGVVLVADRILDEVIGDAFDMIVLPGGLKGMENLRADGRILRLVREMAEQGKYVCAICAAPMVLVAAGVLAGRSATGYPGFLDKDTPEGVAVKTEAVVVDGKIITSRGPGTAMDFALVLVETLRGKAVRDEVEAGLVRC